MNDTKREKQMWSRTHFNKNVQLQLQCEEIQVYLFALIHWQQGSCNFYVIANQRVHRTLRLVQLDPARSADPPTSSGSASASAFSTYK